jgi:hypothetical protein
VQKSVATASDVTVELKVKCGEEEEKKRGMGILRKF